jgi:hypothetical protein
MVCIAADSDLLAAQLNIQRSASSVGCSCAEGTRKPLVLISGVILCAKQLSTLPEICFIRLCIECTIVALSKPLWQVHMREDIEATMLNHTH